MDSLGFCLGQHILAFQIEYPAPYQVQPLPIFSLRVLDSIYQNGYTKQQSISDPVWIFFYSCSAQASTTMEGLKHFPPLSVSKIVFICHKSPTYYLVHPDNNLQVIELYQTLVYN